MKENIIIITNYPVNYRVDFFNSLSLNKNIDYNFIFIPGKEKELSRAKISVYNNEEFLSRAKFIEGNFFMVCFWLLRYLHRFKPNKIIVGGFPKYFIFLVFYRVFFKTKLICWWGGTKLSKKSNNLIEELYRKSMVRFLDGCVYYSELAKEYMHSLRMNLPFEFVLGNNTRDSKRFYRNVSSFNAKNNERYIILTVGSLSKRKNTILILKALSSSEGLKEKVELNIIGEGDEENTLKAFATENNLKVNFLGQIQSDEIFRYYAEADMFVHPSSFDRWPQVYNEAISAGLPTLISNKSEVYDNYIETFSEIVVFDSNDSLKLATMIERLINDKSLRRQLSDFALKTAFDSDGNANLKKFNEFVLSV